MPRLARAAASQRGQQRADTVARTGDHRIIRPIGQPLETAPRHELVAPAWWDDDVEPRGAACMRQLRGRARPRRENRIVAEYDRGARHALGFRPPGSCCVHDTCAAGCDRCNLHGDTMERAGGGTCGAPRRSDKRTGRPEAPRSFQCNRSVSPQNGMSSTESPSGDESSSLTAAPDESAEPARPVAGAPAARGGQITPSHERSRHL